MATIWIGDLARSLESAFGTTGARDQILGPLRSGDLLAICDRFEALNPAAFTAISFPNSGSNVQLPKAFWASSFSYSWADDGEVSYKTSEWDRWTYKVDWGAGNFLVSGTWRRGTRTFSRRAFGVRIPTADAQKLVLAVGISPNFLWSNGRPPHEYVVQWCLEKLRSGAFRGQHDGDPVFKNEFPDLNRDHVFRPALAEAKARL